MKRFSVVDEARVILSPREAQVLELVKASHPNKEIAFRLGVTEGSVKVTIYQLCLGIGLPNRTALAIWAYQHPEAIQRLPVKTNKSPQAA